jgi:hypothetical protein
MQCNDSWLRSSHYNIFQWYTSNDRGSFTVSRLYSYPYKFRDIRKNGLHVCTHKDNKEEFLLITKSSGYGHEVLEKISSTQSGLYYTYIKHVPYVAYKVIF